MSVRHEVVERLLIAKTLLDGIRFQSSTEPTRFSTTTNVLTAHDAAELAIAAIAHQLGVSPPKDQNYLMSYFDPIKQKAHSQQDVYGKDYFSSLNRVRVDIKHYGVFPDARQWARVGETTYGHVSKWCSDYLDLRFSQLDESALLENDVVKSHFVAAREAAEGGKYKESLEELGKALFTAFAENLALRGLEVGKPKPEDAIRLAGYGIHANDFLTMQEFLPSVTKKDDGQFSVSWHQASYGHPGNWRENATGFCLRVFLQVALRIQSAEWVPGAIHFAALYQDQMTSLRDGVELWRMINLGENALEVLVGAHLKKEVVRTLSKGESIRGYASLEKSKSLSGFGFGSVPDKKESVDEPALTFSTDKEFGLLVRLADVRVSCVPRDNQLVKQYFPDLPEVDWVVE
jgi:hypothetical protein